MPGFKQLYISTALLKSILSVTVFLILLAIVIAGYIHMKNQSYDYSDPLEAVPESSAFIFKINDFPGTLRFLKDESVYFSGDIKDQMVNSIARVLDSTDSLSSDYPDLAEWLDINPVYISLNVNEDNGYSFVLHMSLPSGTQTSDVNDAIIRFAVDSQETTSRIYRSMEIKTAFLKENDREHMFEWAITEGILIAAFPGSCLDMSLDALVEGTGIKGSDSFRRLASTAVIDADAYLYFDFEDLPLLVSRIFSPEYCEISRFFESFTGMAGLDIHFREGTVMLNGFNLTNDDAKQYLDLFVNFHGSTNSIERVIPSNTGFFIAIGMDDLLRFNSGYRDFIKEYGGYEEYLEKLDHAGNIAGKGFVDFFGSCYDGQAALWFNQFNSNIDESVPFFAIRMNNEKAAIKELESVSEKLQGVDADGIPGDIEIYKFPVVNTCEILFGRIFSGINTPYMTFWKEYALFGGSSEGLIYIIKNLETGNTLGADPYYNRYSLHLTEGSNLHFFFNFSLLSRIFPGCLNDPWSRLFDYNTKMPGEFKGAGIQISSLRNMIYQNTVFCYSLFSEPAENVEWQILLDTLIDFKPQFIVNHNTGMNEVFVQDLNNNIYLIDGTGNVLWRKQLSGPVLGEVCQIDYYGNGMLQMLFNTENKVYLLDRNGNYVDRYPFSLPSPASNGLSLFDYEGDGNYRIFVPCSDSNVYVFNKQGQKVSGWGFRGAEHPVHTNVQHFRTGGRDYIVFADYYNVYILDRRGNIRVNVPESFPLSRNNNPVFEESPGPRLAVTDNEGRVRYIYFDGRMEEKELGFFTADHFFDYYDIDSDGQREFIFADGRRMEVYKQDNTKLYSREFEDPVTHRPSMYHFAAGNRKTGIVLQNQKKIYLINSDGSLYQGFPLKGRSLFSIGFLDRERSYFNLITGGNDNFLFNYYVH